MFLIWKNKEEFLLWEKFEVAWIKKLKKKYLLPYFHFMADF